MDFTRLKGPRDKIALGLLIPSIMESYHEGFVKEFQLSEITFPALFLFFLRILENSLILIKLGWTHCSSNCLITSFSKKDGGY